MKRKKQRFETILFDVGGTLDADGRHWRSRFHELFTKRRYQIDDSAFTRAYFDADDSLPARYPLKEMGFKATVRALAESLCRNLPGTWEICAAVAQEFTDNSMDHIRRSIAVLSKLRSSHRIGLVSNYYGNLGNALRETGLDRHIDAAVDSDEIGVKKPDPVIFLTALQSLGSHPAEALFVGDSFTRDVIGAQRVGIQPLWLVPRRGAEAWNGHSVPKIHSLTELPEWLEVRQP